MKRFLGALTLVAAVVVPAGCGGDDPDGRAEDPATQGQTEGEQTDAAEPQVVDIVSGVAAGGQVAETATTIESDAVLTRYLRQFRSPVLVDELTAVVDGLDLAADRVLGLAVIEISCNEPPSAEVSERDGEYAVTAGKVVNPHPECYAPVTSVAVLDLPAG